MYVLLNHGQMIADGVRSRAYERALRQRVTPGAVVVDIGTGTGVFAVLACRFGARRVYAIEADDTIALAQEVAVAAGCADRIEFLQNWSNAVQLPERADLIVSDLRGALPLFRNHLPTIIDARRRFLAPDGALIPEQDVLWAAIIESEALYHSCTLPWTDNCHNLDLRAALPIVRNSFHHGPVGPEQLLAPPERWATLDYRTVETSDVEGELRWQVTRSGTAHGLLLWFDAVLAPGIGFCNRPGTAQPTTIYGSGFLPWSEPVNVAVGDTIVVQLSARLVGGEYIWRWDSQIEKMSFRQSTFYGMPLSLERLRRQAADSVPSLGEEGKIDRFILEQMDGQLTLEAIARRLAQHFPGRFDRLQDSLARVGELAQKYGQ
ncbi:50S ribosomal protein L11 methyltransferase [Gloeobacter kilaueensis]|uniref:Ribosomal protein L11 methyltransferase n=1 Tax=Gloeobacter kilaueensis (strain ATCC BAA-2537 / CCAP 1431/1 / ULC 316 / JS1) TaxID=1183438 RepID=U5QHR2_GLOK1|nr:50S ribosomal protein L11 methyltransferase [Gloeobacter kilaueensis]AGY58403.1 ribosomal protein L11 methyltransferase [Gloeobacter kilaueensis JS1]